MVQLQNGGPLIKHMREKFTWLCQATEIWGVIWFLSTPVLSFGNTELSFAIQDY